MVAVALLECGLEGLIGDTASVVRRTVAIHEDGRGVALQAKGAVLAEAGRGGG